MQKARPFLYSGVCALLSVLMFDANSQPMQAGLWKSTVEFHTTTGEMERGFARTLESLKELPKNERKALEAKLPSLYVAGSTVGLSFCVSQEAARHTVPLPVEGGKDENGCATANVVRTGSSIQASFFCSEGDVHGERVVKLSASGDFLVRDINTTHVPVAIDGKQETVTTITNWWFVSKTCGSVPELRR